MSTTRHASRSLLALASLLLTGCYTNSISRPVSDFRNGAVNVTKTVPCALALANDANRAMMIERFYAEKLDLAFTGHTQTVVNPFAPPILDPDALQVRTLALKAIQAYADQLAGLTDGDATAGFDKSASKLGTTLQNADWKDWGLGGGPSPAELGAATTALHAFGEFLVDRDLRADLPKQIDAADPHIIEITTLLDQDLTIIQGVVDRDLRQSAEAWDYSLSRITPKLKPEEARAELTKFVQSIEARQSALTTIAAAREAVDDLREAHRQLRLAVDKQDDHAASSAMSALTAQGQKLKDFYDTAEKSFEPKGSN